MNNGINVISDMNWLVKDIPVTIRLSEEQKKRLDSFVGYSLAYNELQDVLWIKNLLKKPLEEICNRYVGQVINTLCDGEQADCKKYPEDDSDRKIKLTWARE